MKKLKLSTKIALIICAILIVIFAVFITTAVVSSNQKITETTFGQLEAMTEVTGAEIQKIVSTSVSTVKNMCSYIEEAYQTESSVSAIAQDKKNVSQVFSDLMLSESGKEIEKYLLATAQNTILNEDDIAGVGAGFEPYAFTSSKESYSFYLTAEGGKAALTTLGDYAEYSVADYYVTAKNTKRMVITDPYEDANTGVFMVSIISPIMVNGEFKGIVSTDIAIDSFKKIAISSEEYKTLYNTIINQKDILIFHSKYPDKVGSGNDSTFYDAANAKLASDKTSAGKKFNIKCKNFEGSQVYKFYAPITVGEDTWWASSTVMAGDVMESSVNSTILLLSIAVIALVVLVIVIMAVLKKFLNPINDVVAAAKDISQGNLDISLTVQSEDEIGVLSRTFNETAAYLKRIIGEISSVLDSVAQNNLDVDMQEEYLGAFTRIQSAMGNILHNLNQVIGNIGQASEQVASGSDQVSSGAQALSQGATEQASSIQELAATINEISSQIQSNSENALQANGKASAVGEEMNQSNKQMGEMMSAMNEISDRSKEIGKIIKTIEDIAFQTNILALNAAVEAARAGAAGKGFAVVADEVRNLASKSAEASKNTSVLIESSIRAVENGTRIADETAKSLTSAVEGAEELAVTIDKISQASQRQADSVLQVTQGVDQISAVVQTNSATAEQSAAASEELSGQAQVLKGLVSRFHLKDSMNMSGQTVWQPSEERDPGEIPQLSESLY